MAAQNTLPFQYLHRAAYVEMLSREHRTEVLEQRDQELEDYLGTIVTGAAGPPGLPGAPGTDGLVVEVLAGANVTVDSSDPARPIVSATRIDNEVWVNAAAPVESTIELWVDTDEDYPAGGGGDEVHIGASTPDTATAELWVDTDEDYPGGAEEVWIGPSEPVGPYDLWVDTSS